MPVELPDIYQQIETILVSVDIPQRQARDGVMAIMRELGGKQRYLPKPDEVKKALRNAQIRREYNGDNLMEVATKYQLTERHIRDILKEGAPKQMIMQFD